jgi:hypothetical protein
LRSDAASEIAFCLPLETASAFPDMFEHLDSNAAALGLESYGISGTFSLYSLHFLPSAPSLSSAVACWHACAVTTLEEVFLRVGNLSHAPTAADSPASGDHKHDAKAADGAWEAILAGLLLPCCCVFHLPHCCCVFATSFAVAVKVNGEALKGAKQLPRTPADVRVLRLA